MHISLGAYNCKAWLVVLAIPQPYDVILGDEWLREHGARLLYDKQSLEILTKKRRFTIPTIHAPKPTSYTKTKAQGEKKRLLSYIQLRRARAQGLPTYLCYIQKLNEQEFTQDEAGHHAIDVHD